MKKILLIIFLIMAIFQMVVLATDIDIGSAATDRGTSGFEDSYTIVVKENPANETGKITSIEIWAYQDMTGVEVATFYVVSGSNFSTRDSEAIPGTVTAGAKRTFTVDLDVVAGDYIGIYWTGGHIELDTSGEGVWFTMGDDIPADNVEFMFLHPSTVSLYGTGATVEAGNAIFFGMAF